MNLTSKRFDEFFKALYNKTPFPWQSRLALDLAKGEWPDCIDLPTASGKTSVIDIAVFTLACQAAKPPVERTIGRRIFFTVNRRVIVDEAFDRARDLAATLIEAEEKNDPGILGEVARALRSLNEESNPCKAPPLDIAQLRGGVYRDRAWARSLTQPMVVCTTADQLGSRLLFRGYGVSGAAQPIHAALTACDSVILLDEAHVTRPFCETLDLLRKYRRQDKACPPLRFVQMTATPANAKTRFTLAAPDLAHRVLQARQQASKSAKLVELKKKKSIVDDVAVLANGAVSDTRKAVGIIVNRVQTAREIHAELAKKHGENVHLIIGRMRPVDRDDLQDKLRTLVGPDRPDVFPADAKPVFIVATQCLEVGADYDFDALITECASIDALRQRFGRLNRKGRSIEASAAILTNDSSLKGDDPIYGDAIKHTWEWLWSKKDTNDAVDFGIAAFKPLWDGADQATRDAIMSPSQRAAVLLPAHLDALCQTSPQPAPSPDVSYFIHGPQKDMADVNLCWRADLGEDEALWPDIVRLLPPTSTECMTVPLHHFRKWMTGTATKDDRDADVPVATAEDSRDSKDALSSTRRVVVWRGAKECGVISAPGELRPGDTVILRAEDFGWNELGHIPGAPSEDDLKITADESAEAHAERRRKAFASIDVAERATRETRRRVVLRLHDAFSGRRDLRGLPLDELREKIEPLLKAPFDENNDDDRDEQTRILKALKCRGERHRYPNGLADAAEESPDELLAFKCVLDPANRLDLPQADEDDGEDNLSESDGFVSLDDHVEHVVKRLDRALKQLQITDLEEAARLAAKFHDLGKADVRFQALLRGTTPDEIFGLRLLAKSDGTRRTLAEHQAVQQRSACPKGFRHEMLSLELIEHRSLAPDLAPRDLMLHLVASHHGHARPFAPVVIDDATDETRSIEVNDLSVTSDDRAKWSPSHRLDSGVAERFWKLTRKHGWWGLAYLEAILRLADQQASAMEQEGAGR